MQPHDLLFRAVFSQPEHAEGLLRSILPAGVAEHLEFTTLERLPSDFIPPALREQRSDLLFQISADGEPLLVYVLFEHQSSVDPLMPLRVLQYMLRIWEQYLESEGNERAKRVPPIIPIVFHHSETGWAAPTVFSDVLAISPALLSSLAPSLPSFEFLLDDVSHASDEALRTRVLSALGRAAVVCLARLRSTEDVVGELRRFFDVFAAVARSQGGASALGYVISYILLAKETPLEELWPAIRALGPAAEEALMTGAEQLRAEGRAQGFAKGEAKGKAELLARLLRAKFGELPDNAGARLSTATADELDLWAERVLTAATLDEVFA